MSDALEQPWTANRFLAWADAQEARYEFDGLRPIAMTGGTARHSVITNNINRALHARLRGSPCSAFGPDLGVRTVGEAVRSPDAVISCTRFPETDVVVANPVVIFEVISPSAARIDRIDKVAEYALVPSMRRYVIVESRFAGLLVLHRSNEGEPWTALPVPGEGLLEIPEASISVSVADIDEGVMFAD